MAKAKLLYTGSVKNVYQLTEDLEHTLFEYSDRYSIFDWGEMPDLLDHKGEALAMMGALFFEVLTKNNIQHHFIAITDSNGNELQETASRFLKVKNIDVIRPEFLNVKYDYRKYQDRPVNCLLPLEVMFRFGAGTGSSLIKRVKSVPNLLSQWNLNTLNEGDRFERPLIDFSTKLEKGDRYLTHLEAKQLASLSEKEFTDLIKLTEQVGGILQKLLSKMNLDLWDGKIELAFSKDKDANGNRSFQVVDSIGLDELRVETQGQFLSKEFLRDYYRKSSWYQDLNQAKKRSELTGDDVRNICSSRPENLPRNIKNKVEGLYMAFTNDLSLEVSGKNIFDTKFSVSNWIKENL